MSFKDEEFEKWLTNSEEENYESKNLIENNDDTRKLEMELEDKYSKINQESENISREEFYNSEEKTEQNFKDFTQKNDYTKQDFVNREVYEDYADKNYVNEQIRLSKPKFQFVKMAALVLVGAILGSYFGNFFRNENTTKENIGYTSANQVSITAKNEVNVENAVAKKAIPSVVGIKVKFQGEQGFFGTVAEGEGIGSGVIVSSDGYILTNSHVLQDNPTDISVLFSDNTNAQAKIVWQDSTLDLGIIKVEKTGLTPVEFGNSDDISIGDKAIAIGNPVGLNLQSTLTSGYISGLNRSITVSGGSVMNGLIQTDASINSGNSGGALLNSEGKLIGINTAKAGNTDGIGFAIPSNISKVIVDKIIQDGNFSPVTLGVKGINLLNYKQYTANYKIKDDEGFLVSEVVNNTAADKAGIKSGDIIIKIGEDKIESMNKLKQVLINYKPGDKTTITVHRDNKEVVLDLTFEANSPDI